MTLAKLTAWWVTAAAGVGSVVYGSDALAVIALLGFAAFAILEAAA